MTIVRESYLENEISTAFDRVFFLLRGGHASAQSKKGVSPDLRPNATPLPRMRFERMTYCLGGSCSIQLSYRSVSAILRFVTRSLLGLWGVTYDLSKTYPNVLTRTYVIDALVLHRDSKTLPCRQFTSTGSSKLWVTHGILQCPRALINLMEA